jgi:streptomycin 6-kinase
VLAERWGILSAELVADTRSSLVHRVLRRDGIQAITKQLKPGGLHELPGIDLLDWRKGQGMVRLLDRDATICLLEDAGTTTLREYRLTQGEDMANDVIVELLGKTHSASTLAPPETLVPLRRHFRALFDGAERGAVPALSDVLRVCADIADSLLSSQTDIRPLHGDLHHDNIVSGGSRGWLAIDPQGLVGDPAYDVANIFGNPEGAFPEIIDERRILRLTSLFASVIGCSEEKVLRYAIAHAGLSICWSLEDGDRIFGNGNAMERFAFIEAAVPLLNEPTLSS